MPQNDYDRGFNDGLKFVVKCLRSAAAKVETLTYADFERRSADGNGGEKKVFRGVAKTGQPHFATQLRKVATEIESAVRATEAPQDGTKT